MAVSVSISPSGILSALSQSDPPQEVLDSWYAHADELLQTEIYHVTQRTLDRAKRTGALASSVTGRVGTPGSGKLISVWFNNAQQYAEWGRYYAPYQEGPPIGLSTYTNGPRHMLYDSQTDDVGDITDWAVNTGQDAVDSWAGGLA